MLFGGHFEPFWALSGYFGVEVGVRTYSISVLLLLTSACFALVREDDLLSKHSFTHIKAAAVQTILVRYILKK